MAFKTIKGLNGKVYVPEETPECCKKHQCKDCFSCQFCSDDRCSMCTHQEKKKAG